MGKLNPSRWPALVVALVALGFSLWSNWEQNLKWSQLEKPRIVLTKVFLFAFEEIDAESAVSREWGYNVPLFAVSKDGAYTGRYRVYSALAFWDPKHDTPIKVGTKIMTTFEHVESEASRLNLRKFEVRKRYLLQLNLSNSGSLPAYDLVFTLREEKALKPCADTSTNAVQVAQPDEEFNLACEFYSPLAAALPHELRFDLVWSYKFPGGETSQERTLVYEPARNYWTWSN